jgi:hypothetical protein
VKEAPVNFNQSLIPYNQAAKIRDPRKGSFNFPPFLVSSELSSILLLCLRPVFSMLNNQINFQLAKPFTKWVAVICLVANQTYWAFFRAPAPLTRHFYRFKRLFRKFDFRGRCRGKGTSDRNTLAVDHHHPLCSFAPFGRANKGPPFFAGAKLSSIKASCQSSAPFSSSIDKNFRHTSSHTPCSSHSFERLQHKDGLGYQSGRSCHLAPVRSTQRIPSKTARLSAGGRPPFGFGFVVGSSGSSISPLSLFMKRVYLAIGHLPIAYYTQTQQKSRIVTCCIYKILCHGNLTPQLIEGSGCFFSRYMKAVV